MFRNHPLQTETVRRPMPPQSGREQGASLFIALVTLVIITLAGITLMRSVDTGVLVAANVSFKEVTHALTSIGVEQANNYLATTVVSPASPGNQNLPAACSNAVAAGNLGDCRYYARIQARDDVPASSSSFDAVSSPNPSDMTPHINWASANIPPTYLDGNLNVVAAPSVYEIRYVIERLCTPNAAVPVTLHYPARNTTATQDNCHTDTLVPQGSNKGGGVTPPADLVQVKYRITVRATGPRNATSIAQTIVSY